MRKLPATSVWFLYEGAASFLNMLIFTVTAVLFVTEFGLNPLQLVLVRTVMELAVFLFEVPTGVVADTYSRRLSGIVGTLVMGAAFVLVGLAPVFPAILLGYAVWRLGWTFLSCAFEAWVTDEVREERVGYVFMRGAQVYRVGSLLGIGASVGLATIDLRLLIVLGGALTALLGLVVAMDETTFRRAPKGERSWRAMGRTARVGGRLVRRQPCS